MSEELSDTEMLDWIADQLWNGWRFEYYTAKEVEVIEPSGFKSYVAPTLREAINKANKET